MAERATIAATVIVAAAAAAASEAVAEIQKQL